MQPSRDAEQTSRAAERFLRLRGQEGTALLLSILIMGAISILGTTMVLNSITDRQIGTLHWEEAQAFSAAETGIAFAIRMIHDMNAPLADGDKDGRPDFVVADTLAGGASYRVVAEASDYAALDASAYRTAQFTLIAEGRRGQAVRRVTVEIEHDSFLKYQRFCADETPGYDCGAVVTGEVYAKGDLWIPSDCASHPVEFLEPVMVREEIENAVSAVFHRGYFEYAELIDLKNSVDFDALRSRTRGLLSVCDCEGRGQVGIYCDLKAGSFPIMSLAGLPMPPVVSEINLSSFDFLDGDASPGDTLVTYAGYPIRHAVSGKALRSDEFNGLVFCEGELFVKGSLDGKSGRNLTLVASDDIYVMNDIITGHTGYDLGTGVPTGTGEPVNLGLVAKKWIKIYKSTPRILRVDATLLSVEESWKAEGSTDDHPAATVSVYDLDLDGIAGESPVNDDPYPGRGWDEQQITEATWMLNFTGPIITWKRGDAGPWKDAKVLAAASDMTRRYNYDLDIQSYPPPCFPVPINLWNELSWSELHDTQRDLLSFVLIER